jgi:hypothetical protein
MMFSGGGTSFIVFGGGTEAGWGKADTEVKAMAAEITRRDGEEVTVSVTIRLDGPMLEVEEAIQEALNEVGMLLEKENLARFDTDGSPIQVGPVRLTSKGLSPQVYETPFRHFERSSGDVGVVAHFVLGICR